MSKDGKAHLSENPKSEWSFWFSVEGKTLDQREIRLEANEQERKDVARRLGLESLDLFAGKLVLHRKKGGNMIHVSGTLQAKFKQPSGVTLDPMEEEIEAPVEGWFVDKEDTIQLARVRQDREARRPEHEVKMLEEYEDPEPLLSGAIDLGELLTQHLSLEINPYPRENKPGKDDVAEEIIHHEPRKNPFAALQDWKFGPKDESKK